MFPGCVAVVLICSACRSTAHLGSVTLEAAAGWSVGGLSLVDGADGSNRWAENNMLNRQLECALATKQPVNWKVPGLLYCDLIKALTAVKCYQKLPVWSLPGEQVNWISSYEVQINHVSHSCCLLGCGILASLVVHHMLHWYVLLCRLIVLEG